MFGISRFDRVHGATFASLTPPWHEFVSAFRFLDAI
jgi:hypothetical protein